MSLHVPYFKHLQKFPECIPTLRGFALNAGAFSQWELRRFLFKIIIIIIPKIPDVALPQARCKCHLLAYLKKFTLGEKHEEQHVKVPQKLLRKEFIWQHQKPPKLVPPRRGGRLVIQFNQAQYRTPMFFTTFHLTNDHINELCWNKISCQQHHVMFAQAGRPRVRRTNTAAEPLA